MDEIKTAPGKLRIGLYTDVPRGIPPHPDVQAVFDATAENRSKNSVIL